MSKCPIETAHPHRRASPQDRLALVRLTSSRELIGPFPSRPVDHDRGPEPYYLLIVLNAVLLLQSMQAARPV